MDKKNLYNKYDPKSIESYALKLVGKTFLDVIIEKSNNNEDAIKAYGNLSRKGGLGNLLEEVYFEYKANSNQDADFKEAGVELKASPFEYTKKGELRAGERLVLTMISYDGPVEIDFYSSHAWNKMRSILLIYYWRNKELKDNLLYKIGYASLFSPPKADLTIIKADYDYIIEKIEKGLAHELSEGDTMYLGACTKGATAEKSTVKQYYGDNTLARKRAFCFKNSYMTYILNNYIAGQSSSEETIIKDINVLSNKKFSDVLIEKINTYIGKTDLMLAEKFEVNLKNKGNRALLTYGMLGVKGNKAEEFIKANIEVKTIKFNKNGINPEHTRLHDFKFKTMAEESWEESELLDYLETTQILFVVYKETDNGIVLQGSQLWHMSQSDIEIVRRGWQAVNDKLNTGVNLWVASKSDTSEIIGNDLPGSKDNEIFHVRPHEAQTHYKFADGGEHGKGTMKNCDELPDGQWMPKHSYWMNKQYIYSQLKDDLKKG